MANAKARYVAASEAVDRALMNPSELDSAALTKAGIGGESLDNVVDDARTLAEGGWYLSGTGEITDTRVLAVKLDGGRPEVVLANCHDSSKQIIRFKVNGKRASAVDPEERHHELAARLLLAGPAGGGPGMWTLVSDRYMGDC